MGLLAALRPGTPSIDELPSPLGLSAPWAPDNHLAQVVWSDLFPDAPRPLTRADAIRVPAVARARHVICTTIARIELGAYRGDDRLTGNDEPSWIAQTDGVTTPFHRMLWTVDDLLFYGWSLWRVTRWGADSTGAWPLRMERVPMGQWRLEEGTGRVLLVAPDGAGGWTWAPAPNRSVVLIPGPHEGLLTEAAPAIRHARDLQRAAHNAGRFPSAYLVLKNKSGNALKKRSTDDTEVTVESVLRDWREARLNPDGGGVAYAGQLDVEELGTFDAHLLTEGRNAASVDVARHASIPADLIDAVVSESSLHYSTSRDNDRRAIDYGLGGYMSAFSARMTQTDVTPRGQHVAFDLERWLKGDALAPGQPTAAPPPGLTPAPQQPTPTTGETPQ